MQYPPDGTDAQMAWLVDRACIGELLGAYAHCVDTKDWATMVTLFTQDGMLEMPYGKFAARDLPKAAAAGLGPYEVTHHISVSQSISISGDVAQSRSCFIAIHVPKGSDAGRHGDIGGWYDNTYCRVNRRWMLANVRATFLWTAGSDFPGSEWHLDQINRKANWQSSVQG
jgi:hypothetical protein